MLRSPAGLAAAAAGLAAAMPMVYRGPLSRAAGARCWRL